MKKCRYCGEKIQQDALFCSFCGRYVAEDFRNKNTLPKLNENEEIQKRHEKYLLSFHDYLSTKEAYQEIEVFIKTQNNLSCVEDIYNRMTPLLMRVTKLNWDTNRRINKILQSKKNNIARILHPIGIKLLSTGQVNIQNIHMKIQQLFEIFSILLLICINIGVDLRHKIVSVAEERRYINFLGDFYSEPIINLIGYAYLHGQFTKNSAILEVKLLIESLINNFYEVIFLGYKCESEVIISGFTYGNTSILNEFLSIFEKYIDDSNKIKSEEINNTQDGNNSNQQGFEITFENMSALVEKWQESHSSIPKIVEDKHQIFIENLLKEFLPRVDYKLFRSVKIDKIKEDVTADLYRFSTIVPISSAIGAECGKKNITVDNGLILLDSVVKYFKYDFQRIYLSIICKGNYDTQIVFSFFNDYSLLEQLYALVSDVANQVFWLGKKYSSEVKIIKKVGQSNKSSFLIYLQELENNIH